MLYDEIHQRSNFVQHQAPDHHESLLYVELVLVLEWWN